MRIRKIPGDQHSAEFDQVRKTLNNLLRMLETAAASITAGATAEDVLNVWSAGITAGVDSNPNAVANVVSSNGSLVGLKPTNGASRRRLPFSAKDTEEDDQFDL